MSLLCLDKNALCILTKSCGMPERKARPYWIVLDSELRKYSAPIPKF